METKNWSKDVSFPSKETLGNFWVWCNKGHFILILDLQHLQISQQHLPLNLWITRKPHLRWATLRQKELMHYAPGCSYSPHFNSALKRWVDTIPVPKWNMMKHHKLLKCFFVCWYLEKNWVPNPWCFDILTTRPAGASRWWKKSRHLGHPTTNRLPQGDVQLMSSLRSSQISTFPLSHWEMNLAAQGFTNGHLVGFCWKLGAFLWDFQEIPTDGSDDDAALDGRHPAPVYRYCLPLITAFFWLQLPENHPMQPIILINPVMNLRNRPLNDPSLHEHSFKKWIDMNEQLNSQLKRKITKKQLKDNISGAFFLLVTKKKSVVVNRFIPY